LTKQEYELLLIGTQKEAEEYGKKIGIAWRTVYFRRKKLVEREKKKFQTDKQDEAGEKDKLIKARILRQKETSIENLSETFDVSIQHIAELVDALIYEGHLINVSQNNIKLLQSIEPPAPIKIDIAPFYNRWIKFGAISDTHLNSKYQRLEVLNALYDIFEREGIKNVFHAGNIIDGFSRLNQFDVFNSGVDEQVEYCVQNYPKKNDMITHFITADEHEGWYVQREHINIGKLIEQTALENNRNDLHHLGYIEADVKVSIGKRDTVLRVFHPGGGTAYAISYLPQKIIESLEGGNKPDFMIIGHSHKHETGEVRNVPYIQAGCTQDQTPFMRKRHNEAHIGGYIIELEISEEGNIYRMKSEFFKFYNKEFYEIEKKTAERTVKSWEYKW
jgi:predicted phosphodiesterase